MAILVAVLILTTLGIAATGFLALRGVNEQMHDLAAVTLRDNELCTDIRLNLMHAVRAQKNAVISPEDKPSQEFADQSRAASREVERLRKELINRRGSDPSLVIRQALEGF